MEGERDVVVDVAEPAVDVPVRAAPAPLEVVERCAERRRIEARADPFEPEGDENSEELPVVLAGLVLEDSGQPRDEPLPRRGVERLPRFLRTEGEREADRRLLDHPLIRVTRHRPPVLLRGRVRPCLEPGREPVPVVEPPPPTVSGTTP